MGNVLLQDGPFDPEPFRKGLARRAKEKEFAIERRVAEARAFLDIAKEAFLRIDPRMRKLLLFGSLSHGRPSSLDFDMDLAVSSDRYLRLVAWTLDQEWKIDLVDLDGIAGTKLADLETEAEILYEKS
jgi:hypothetical protein